MWFTVGMTKTETRPMIDQLRSRQVRLTGPRRAVLSLLEKERLPLSAKEVWEKIPAPKSDLVSVYRILERFGKEGIVSQVQLGDHMARFELLRGHHHHVRCTGCGKVADVDLCIKDIEKKVQRQSGFHIAFHDLQLTGFCARCSKRAR